MDPVRTHSGLSWGLRRPKWVETHSRKVSQPICLTVSLLARRCRKTTWMHPRSCRIVRDAIERKHVVIGRRHGCEGEAASSVGVALFGRERVGCSSRRCLASRNARERPCSEPPVATPPAATTCCCAVLLRRVCTLCEQVKMSEKELARARSYICKDRAKIALRSPLAVHCWAS